MHHAWAANESYRKTRRVPRLGEGCVEVPNLAASVLEQLNTSDTHHGESKHELFSLLHVHPRLGIVRARRQMECPSIRISRRLSVILYSGYSEQTIHSGLPGHKRGHTLCR